MADVTPEYLAELDALLAAVPDHALRVEIRPDRDSVHYTVCTVDKLPEHPWSARYVATLCGSLGERLARNTDPYGNVDPDKVRTDPEARAYAELFARAPEGLRRLRAEVDRLRTRDADWSVAYERLGGQRERLIIDLDEARAKVERLCGGEAIREFASMVRQRDQARARLREALEFVPRGHPLEARIRAALGEVSGG